MTRENETKKCNKCGRELPLTAFYVKIKNGQRVAVQSRCKECKHKYDQENREKQKKKRDLLLTRLKGEASRLKTLEKDNPWYFEGVRLPSVTKISINQASVSTYDYYCRKLVELSSTINRLEGYSQRNEIVDLKETLSLLKKERDGLVREFNIFIVTNKRKRRS